MNPLSKAFVILVTLLTVALSCFSIAVVGAQDQYKKERDETKLKLDASLAQLRTAQENSAKVESEQHTKITETEQALALITQQLGAAEGAAKTGQFELNKTKADLESVTAAFKIATINLDRTTQEREAYAQQFMSTMKQAQESGKTVVEARGRIAELSDKLRRAEIDLLRYKEETGALAKQVEDKAKQVSQLEGKLGERKLPGTTTVAATQTITGSVTSVGKASNGVTLVAVDVGEKDQVAPGMEFTINRGSDYIATMIITSVNTEVAVGRLTNEQGSVSRGDSVYVRGYSR